MEPFIRKTTSALVFLCVLCSGCEQRRPADVRLIEEMHRAAERMPPAERRERARAAAESVSRRYASLTRLDLKAEVIDWPQRRAGARVTMGYRRHEAELFAEGKLAIRLSYDDGLFREHRLAADGVSESTYMYVPPYDEGSNDLHLIDDTPYDAYGCMWGGSLSSWVGGPTRKSDFFRSRLADATFIGSCLWESHVCEVYLYEQPIDDEMWWDVFYVRDDDLVVRFLTVPWRQDDGDLRLLVPVRIRNFRYGVPVSPA